jgi:sugar O-acyltransferase (sialic acid O-acetyltransferase NeuD family)
MKKRLALIGSKEFAQQIRGFAEDSDEFIVVGYFDDFESKGTIVEGLPILGSRKNIEESFKNNEFDEIFLAAGYNNFQFREFVFEELKGKIPFANIIMPGVQLHSSVKIGRGVYIGERSFIGKNVVIGDNNFIHERTSIAHDCIIGNHNYFSGLDSFAGHVVMGDRIFVGLNVCVADNISITDDVWIGIGATVAQNLKEPLKYMSMSTRLVPVKK